MEEMLLTRGSRPSVRQASLPSREGEQAEARCFGEKRVDNDDAQTMVDQQKIQSMSGPVRMRSAAPPTAMQAVTVANWSWKKANKRPGILLVATEGSPRTFMRPKLCRVPMKGPPLGAKVSE